MEAYPDAAGAILKNGVRLIGRHALAGSVRREQRVAEPCQSAIGADPEVAFAVLKQAAHQAALAVVALRGHEAIAFQASDAGVGAHPDIAVAILRYRANKGVRQAVARIVPAGVAVGRAADKPAAASDPQIAITVAGQETDEIALEGRIVNDGHEPAVFHPEHGGDTRHP